MQDYEVEKQKYLLIFYKTHHNSYIFICQIHFCADIGHVKSSSGLKFTTAVTGKSF